MTVFLAQSIQNSRHPNSERFAPVILYKLSTKLKLNPRNLAQMSLCIMSATCLSPRCGILTSQQPVRQRHLEHA